jgi:hypothetical protein
MTKAELIKMLENVEDNAELTFVKETYDRDGFPEDTQVEFYKVLSGEIVRVRHQYGVRRYENKTDDLEYSERYDCYVKKA